MASHNNQKNNTNQDKAFTAKCATSSEKCPKKRGYTNSLNLCTKLFAFTLLVLYTFKDNVVDENGLCKTGDLKNVRMLSEVNGNFRRYEDDVNMSREDLNSRRDYNGGFTGNWTPQENEEYRRTYHRANDNMESGEYGNNNSNEMNFSCFNSGLCQKLKKNALYIIPSMIGSYYAWNYLGTQNFLLVAVIIGALFYANYNPR
ncbi:Plasmodium exported protein, unknown function [Plasmodium ovale wallikeri]|uniref:Uncharacterized protein n=2 Tax=Plasmodium ovale TaxID=36330 RepID=A0A1A9ATB8_PLAOA|nr:Plasmodium exported protein, unknown function [Plasmodium ovale wallikeri]SBT59360.1 Plasmodium exported protein, unknown function [Plasmodium ovale wallikeri]SBT72499.1 Plasmodium exported protein, unknown function [Plasmodium ovale]